jgi:hypothetical protein
MAPHRCAGNLDDLSLEVLSHAFRHLELCDDTVIMAPSVTSLDDLPLEVLTHVCRHLRLGDLVRVGASCKRFRHGDGGLETVELLTESPVITALREHAFPLLELAPRIRPSGFSDSWVTYLARCMAQRRCREVASIAAGNRHSLFLDKSGRLLACGCGVAVGHDDANIIYDVPTPLAAMSGVRVQSVAAGCYHSLALGWDGRVYSWGENSFGQLGQGDTLTKRAPALVEGLEGVRGIAAAAWQSLAMTELGFVFSWGRALLPGAENALMPLLVEGFDEGVCLRSVCFGERVAVAISGDREVFSWGAASTGVSATATRRTSPRPSASRRCGVSG